MEDYQKRQRDKWLKEKSTSKDQTVQFVDSDPFLLSDDVFEQLGTAQSDEELARALQAEEYAEYVRFQQATPPSQEIVSEDLTHPDIHSLFNHFNARYFDSRLAAVEVKWSKKMTLCAGLCCYEGRGGLCVVKLSEPLLKFRTRQDLIDTLLHEMIHAFLFVTQNNRDREGHGENFLAHAHRINAAAGSHITVYHNFHDEVNVYRTHWWQCQGKCKFILKRAMNRPPGPKDPWWPRHQAQCGGAYVKIREPEDYKKPKQKRPKQEKSSDVKPVVPAPGVPTVLDFFKKSPKKEAKPLEHRNGDGDGERDAEEQTLLRKRRPRPDAADAADGGLPQARSGTAGASQRAGGDQAHTKRPPPADAGGRVVVDLCASPDRPHRQQQQLLTSFFAADLTHEPAAPAAAAVKREQGIKLESSSVRHNDRKQPGPSIKPHSQTTQTVHTARTPHAAPTDDRPSVRLEDPPSKPPQSISRRVSGARSDSGTCPVCEQTMPVSELGSHVEAHFVQQ